MTTSRRLLWLLWLLGILLVVVGSLLPAASPAIHIILMVPVGQKALHFLAYLTLACLPAVAFRDRRTGIAVASSMFILGVLLEGSQHYSAGRTAELSDLVINGAGVGFGVLLAFPIRTRFNPDGRHP